MEGDNVEHDKLTELRDHYDATDQTAALDSAELVTAVTEDPMVGITVRLPASTLNAARAVAAQQGIRVTALIRQWVEHHVSDQVDDQRVVSVSELRKLIARAS